MSVEITSDFIKGLRVLVVDDHMVMQKLLEKNLRDLGFEHIECANGFEEAADKLAKKDKDIVFLDWHMPGKSGYSILQDYRGERDFDDVAIVMVTAEYEERSVIEALKAGATSYIVKPFSQPAFQEHVQNILKWVLRHPQTKNNGALQK